MQTIAISIDTETLRQVDRLRVARRTSRSELIRTALQRFVEDQERLAWETKDAALYKKHGKMINAQVSAALDDQADL